MKLEDEIGWLEDDEIAPEIGWLEDDEISFWCPGKMENTDFQGRKCPSVWFQHWDLTCLELEPQTKP